jgi:hypothetical protein
MIVVIVEQLLFDDLGGGLQCDAEPLGSRLQVSQRESLIVTSSFSVCSPSAMA